MRAFRSFAARTLRYRWTLVGAFAAAALAAISLGGGLIGVLPVLRSILGEKLHLADLAREWNAHAHTRFGIPPAWIDALPRGPFTAICWIIGVLGMLTILGGLAGFLHQYLALTIVQRTVAGVRREAFHRVLRLPLRRVVSDGATDTVSRIVNDSAQLEAGLTAMLSRAVAQVAKGIGAIGAALVINWQITLLAGIVAPVFYTIIRRLGKRIRRASRKALASQAGLYGAATQALQGLRVVKVHTTERLEAGRFHRLNKEMMRQMLRVRTARAVASPLVEVLSIFVLGGLFLFAAKLMLDGHWKSPTVLVALGALFAAGAALKPLTGLLNDIQASSAAADRLAELIRSHPEPGHDAALPKLPRHKNAIELRAATLIYPGADRPALDRVDLIVRHGERVAIVGPNGSGKTTLLSLVPRLFDPDSGSVLIDGRDLREVSVRSVRRQIGVVTQETVLFRGTIRDNIAYGADDATTERVIEAARRARAHDFIAALPAGYDTPVGEQGLTLSGGQRQRIAIARAVLRDPAILILDEATSMIDADSEARIAEALAEFTVGRTCLIVAHRLSTVLNADRIVVMDAGRVVDQGTHPDLLVRCAVYRLIAENQLFRPRDGGER
ncbi:MAG: ABC transporter ATP-binding protein [Phycisphaerales bacterium]